MRAPERLLRSTVRVDDLTRLLGLPGPFATVAFGHEEPAEDSVSRRRLRWTELRHELLDAGAPEPVADAVGPVVLEEPDGLRGVVVIADESGVRHVSRHPEPPSVEHARWAPLPSYTQIIHWRQITPPHVVVLVDRSGADVHIVGDGEADLSVEGAHDVVNKPAQGGWSHRRIEARAEDSWTRNAEAVAALVSRAADAAAARLLAVSGDPRAVPLVVDALPAPTRRLVEVVDGGSRDAGLRSIDAEVGRLVANVAAEDTVSFLRTVREELGQHDRAVEGARDVLGALARGQVEILGVHDTVDDERAASFGPDAHHVAVEPQELRDMGVERPVRGRLPDVVVRGALLTGAAVHVMPWHAGPRDGMCALLRWQA